MPTFAEHEPIYRAYKQFVELCLLNDKSLLWPDKTVWTTENVAEIKRRFVDEPILGTEMSFTEKLQQQLQGASPDLWRLLGDIYYLYYLPSKTLTIQGKRAAIGWAVEQSGGESPTSDPSVWRALEIGFARTGQHYHLKFPQFRLIMLWAQYIKQHPDVLRDAIDMQHVLDDINKAALLGTERAQDMRNALLYMTFPELYEPSLSGTDKHGIVQFYSPRVTSALPVDVDEAILRIREVISRDTAPEMLPFSFYSDEFKSQWKAPKTPAKSRKDEPLAGEDEDDDLPEEPTQTEPQRTMIFMSYRRDDSGEVIGRIYEWLVREFSEELVFRDIYSIPLGVNFKKYLDEMVSKSKVLLAIIGKDWLMPSEDGEPRIDNPADFVRIEIESAFSQNILVIPITVQGARTPSENVLPDSLKELAWRNGMAIGSKDPGFGDDMHRLIRALRPILKDQ